MFFRISFLCIALCGCLEAMDRPGQSFSSASELKLAIARAKSRQKLDNCDDCITAESTCLAGRQLIRFSRYHPQSSWTSPSYFTGVVCCLTSIHSVGKLCLHLFNGVEYNATTTVAKHTCNRCLAAIQDEEHTTPNPTLSANVLAAIAEALKTGQHGNLCAKHAAPEMH